jgi:hypothetical protein
VIAVVMAMMLDDHNLLVMAVHVAVMVAIPLDDDDIVSFRRRGERHGNSERRKCTKSDSKFSHYISPTQQYAGYQKRADAQ